MRDIDLLEVKKEGQEYRCYLLWTEGTKQINVAVASKELNEVIKFLLEKLNYDK